MAVTGPTRARGGVWVRIGSPPWRDRRFWLVQLLILAVVLGHLGLDLRDQSLPQGVPDSIAGMPDSIVTGLILIPVVYAALNFGLGGAAASAAWSILLMLPDMVLVEAPFGRWVDGTVLVLAAVGAVAVGLRVDREAEAARASSAAEARYRALFEASSAPTLVLTRADGAVREVNPAAAALFGAGVGRRRLEDLLGAEPAAAVLSGEPPRTVTVVAADGTVRAVRPLAARISDRGSDQLLQVVLHDLTQEEDRRHRAEVYAAQLLRAQEEERRRVAQDLHDEPLQTLIYLLRRLDYLAHSEELAEPVRRDLEATHAVLGRVVSDIRQMAQGLRPSGLDDLGLGAALRHLAAEMSERTGIPVSLAIGGDAAGLSSDLRSTLFRIVQEALMNAERHSGATTVTVEVNVSPAEATARIEDDGRGLAAPDAGAGMGILGMEERAAAFGGRVEVGPGALGGTRVGVTLPRAQTNPGTGPRPVLAREPGRGSPGAGARPRVRRE